MASINKLSIRGIRAFSPDDDEQVLEFYFPCTIIVGANGCGKTTIIESLKFAVCGALPPGNKAGQAFVHDPKSIGQSTVKAQIKLRFTNRGGRTQVVIRSMELAQKKTTMSFKQLDGVIRMTDDDGNRQSLSHKCSELDRQLPVLLGVSKAILEHVVFCHQEDANWPLQEGAVLKKRFDDIFDSTRYTKALEVFNKLKKEYTAKAKDHKTDVAGFSSHLHAAKGFQAEIEKYSDQLELVEQEIEEYNDDLKQTEDEENRLIEILDQVDLIQLDIEEKNNSLHTLTELANKTGEMLENDLSEEKSARELKEMLRDFDTKLKDQIDEMEDLESHIGRLKKEASKLVQEDSKLQSQLGKYQAEKDAQEERQKLRFEKMVYGGNAFDLNSTLTACSQSQSMTQNSSFQESSVQDSSSRALSHQPEQPVQLEISKDDLDDYFRALAKKKRDLEEDLNHKKKLRRRAEDELQSVLGELEGKLQSIKNDQMKLTQECEDSKKELRDISTRAPMMSRMRKDDVEDARRLAAVHAADLEKANKDPRRNQIATEIRSLEDKSHRLKREIEDDSDALKDLRHTAEAQHEITVLKQQIERDVEDLKESLQESDFALKSKNIQVPIVDLPEDETGSELNDVMDNLTEEVTSKFQTADLDLQRATEDLHRIQNVLSEKSALLARDQQLALSKRDRLAHLSSENGSIKKVENVVFELRRFEASIGVTTPPALSEAKPQELFYYLEEKLEREESENTEGIQPVVVKKIMKKLKKKARTLAGTGEFVCPCCKRGLDTEEAIKTFQEQMQVLMSEDSPLIEADEKNKTARSSYAKWRKIVKENMQDILEYRRIANEVNDIEHSCSSLEVVVAERKDDLDNSKASQAEIKSEVEGLRSLLENCKMWQGAVDRINNKKSQAMNKSNTLSIRESVHDGRDLQTVERDLAEKTEKREDFQQKISRLNKETTTLNQRLAQLSKAATEYEKLAKEKEEKFAGFRKMVERKAALQEVITRNEKQLLILRNNIKPVRDKKSKKEMERDRMRKHSEDQEDEIRKTTEKLKMFENEVRELQRQIEDFDNRNDADTLERIRRQSENFKSQRKEKEVNISKIQPHLEQLKKALDDQERHKRNLKENLNLLDLQSQIRDIKRELKSLKESAGKIRGRDTAKEDIQNLQRRKTKLGKQNARLEGRRGEIHENIRSMKRKLSQPEYRNVEEEYRIATIKQDTTEMAVRDIGKYHAALDKALQRFHSLKLSEINQIIKDLWSLTYKGEDITSIQLVSGKDSGSRSTRSYNYRVVMTKGATELDMRGRCSAGQRVLASIVIRLALAETFCVNCGCIALDEPTVNLDYRNKKGLAVALAQIIASRAKQINFQLIMITHDEDFVAIMKTELASQTGFSMPEKYFQVRREEGADGKFYSKIDAVDWEELV